jgi:hypothetical protein
MASESSGIWAVMAPRLASLACMMSTAWARRSWRQLSGTGSLIIAGSEELAGANRIAVGLAWWACSTA